MTMLEDFFTSLNREDSNLPYGSKWNKKFKTNRKDTVTAIYYESLFGSKSSLQIYFPPEEGCSIPSEIRICYKHVVALSTSCNPTQYGVKMKSVEDHIEAAFFRLFLQELINRNVSLLGSSIFSTKGTIVCHGNPKDLMEPITKIWQHSQSTFNQIMESTFGITLSQYFQGLEKISKK